MAQPVRILDSAGDPISATNPLEVDVKTLAAPTTLPLPTGASTATLQTAGNQSLASMDADLGATTDAPASASTDEDATARSLIALAKGLKNLQIDIKTLLETTGIAFLPLDDDIDSIDVSKMSAGAVTTAHSAITATATSSEIDCRGFNSLRILWVSDATDKTWVISLAGAMTSGGTFVPPLSVADGTAKLEVTTDISGYIIVYGIMDYMKVVATETDDGATVSCYVQPFNG
jgi:hypothetical protein